MPRSERRDGRGLVEPDKRVELLRQRGVGVMTHQLRVGSVDNADEPLQPRLQKASSERLVLADVEQEARNVRIVTHPLVAMSISQSEDETLGSSMTRRS